MSPWDRPPNEGLWFHTGKNLRASHSKVKASLFRDTHSIDRVSADSEGERPQGARVVSFNGLGNFIG